MKILLLDIDHTVFDAAWRDDMLADRDWDAYHAAGKDDQPINEVVHLVNDIHNAGWTIYALTARPEKWRNQTMKQFVDHGINVDWFLMRPTDDYSSAGESKIKLLQKEFGPNLEGFESKEVILIDDNEKVIEVMRANNITTMQISVAKRRT